MNASQITFLYTHAWGRCLPNDTRLNGIFYYSIPTVLQRIIGLYMTRPRSAHHRLVWVAIGVCDLPFLPVCLRERVLGIPA